MERIPGRMGRGGEVEGGGVEGGEGDKSESETITISLLKICKIERASSVLCLDFDTGATSPITIE